VPPASEWICPSASARGYQKLWGLSRRHTLTYFGAHTRATLRIRVTWHKFAIIILRPVALFCGGVFLLARLEFFAQSPRRFNLLWLAATPAPVFWTSFVVQQLNFKAGVWMWMWMWISGIWGPFACLRCPRAWGHFSKAATSAANWISLLGEPSRRSPDYVKHIDNVLIRQPVHSAELLLRIPCPRSWRAGTLFGCGQIVIVKHTGKNI